MASVIAQRELRNSNADILNRVEAGESFVVTRNGIAVADVVPHSAQIGPPTFPRTADLLAQAANEPGITLDADSWLRDIRSADDVVGDDPLDSRG